MQAQASPTEPTAPGLPVRTDLRAGAYISITLSGGAGNPSGSESQETEESAVPSVA